MRIVSWLTLCVALMPSCRSSVNVQAKASVGGGEQTQSQDTAPQADSVDVAPPLEVTEYFGVARRLTLKPGARPAVCSCVAAHVGSPADPAFDWHGPAPGVGADALVVAISAEGIPCEQKGRGPSIAGVERVGNDVVIFLEEFHDARPLALGAIVPNPGAEGSVYLRARGRAPYGRPTKEPAGGGGQGCRVSGGTGATSHASEADDSSAQ